MAHATSVSPPADGALRPRDVPLLALLLAIVFVAFFRDVLLWDQNFVYRDAGHFYYPYFKLVHQIWQSGRVPLWNPYENGGAPLAANPTACAFYPLQLLFLLPYPLAFKWYHLVHVLIAWGTCFGACRRWGVSGWGSALSAFAYAFGGFVLFQIYNVVFLVGAAWLPLALYAADRLVRRPSVGSSLILACVLALQVLGGDPQVAFLVVVGTIPYFLFHQFGAGRGLWTSASLFALGWWIVQWGDWRKAPEPWPTPWVAGLLVAGVVVFAVAGLLARRLGRRRRDFRLPIATGLLAVALCAVQVLPTMFFTRTTDRHVPEAPRENVAFSLFPARVLECIAPTCFGMQLPVNTRWAPFQKFETGVWVPNLYMGLATLLLGTSALHFRRGDPLERWLSWIFVISLWLAIGKFGGTYWLRDPNLGKPFDAVRAKRGSTEFGPSDGLYWLFEEAVPGFHSFRYPSKLLVFSCLALAVLAGRSLDRHLLVPNDRLRRVTFGMGIGVGLALALVLIGRGPCTRWLASIGTPTDFGPFLVDQAWRGIVLSLAQACLTCGALGWLLAPGRAKGGVRTWIPMALVIVLCVDLWAANRWMLFTDDQTVLDEVPEVAKVIQDAEAAEGNDQPFRVHRTRIYAPFPWRETSSPRRMIEMSRWERRTLQPKYGTMHGIEYTAVTGTMSIYDVEFFFAPWVVRTPEAIRQSNPNSPEVMTYFPRVGYNLWNTKYFILPKYVALDHDERGVMTMMVNYDGTPCPLLAQSPPDGDDYMVLKNLEALPRSWVVHRADIRPTIVGTRRRDRTVPMEQLLYRSRDGGIPLWVGMSYGDYPLRSQVMIETDDPASLLEYQSLQPTSDQEEVHFEEYQPDHVRMKVRMQSPGLLVLADTYYPGWSATVDGSPATVYRANRAMRAVALGAGDHVVEMRYRSLAFEIGAVTSAIAWLAVIGFGLTRLISRNQPQSI